MAGLIWKELWHDPKTCDWSRQWSSDIGWLWVKLISFVEDHNSGGVVTVLQALTVATLNHIPTVTVNQLVEAKGLDVVAGGYQIHNYRKRRKLSRIRAASGRLGGLEKASKMSSKNSSKSPLANGELDPGGGVGVVERIFSKWSDDLGRVVRLTPGRRKATLARLKDGYTEADLSDAALGWRNDPWPDRVNQNDLTQLFRNGEQVEKFRDLHRNGRPTTPPQSQAVRNAMVLMGRNGAA